MERKLIFLVIFISSLKLIHAAKTIGRNRGSSKIHKDCPTVNNLDSLVLKKLKGTWLVIFSSVKNSTDKCTRFVFSVSNSSSVISLFKKSIRRDGVEVKMMGTAVELEPGSFSANYPAYPALSKFYDVLNTDYINYAIFYTCDTDYNVWILSRKTSIEQQHLSLALRELVIQGLTNFYLYPTLQDCSMLNNF